MDQAFAICKDNGAQQTVSASQIQRLVDNDTPIKKQFDFVAIHDGSPLHFRAGHTRNGHAQNVRPTFVHAAGYGCSSHLFARNNNKSNLSFDERLSRGDKILLNLNLDLDYVGGHYSPLAGSQAYTYGHFIQHTSNKFIPVAIHSAHEAIETILKVAQHPNPTIKASNTIFARYRGGIMSYNDFYLGRRAEDLSTMFNQVSTLQHATQINKNRIVGFPRLINFEISKNSLDSFGTKAIRGNSSYLQKCKKTRCDQLIFSSDDIADTPAFSSLWNQLSESVDFPQMKGLDQLLRDTPLNTPRHNTLEKERKSYGVFVMASPVVAVSPYQSPDASNWEYTLWMINDIEKQITPPLSHTQQNNEDFKLTA